MTRTRLSPEKWLDAGEEALIASGPAALAAEPLARALGTTKGSFYWHFKDVPAFQAALIDRWSQTALSHLAKEVSSDLGADARLRQFGQTILNDKTEAALRAWAQTHPALAKTLQELDAERLTYLTLLLRELGLGNQRFAIALQAALVGLPQLGSPHSEAEVFETLVDTVLALA